MSSQLRMSGLISGIDTDSIISALVSTRRVRVDNLKGEQTKMSWKQEIWKDLNKELKSLMSTASNMRYSTAFAKKTTSVSNPNKASVITADTAVKSVQSLQIDELAKTAYLTGGTVTTDGSATALTTMSELGFSGKGSFTVTSNGESKTIEVDGSSTISDVLSQFQKAGLNASFDASNQRLFISAKESGADANFVIKADNADGDDALAKLGLQNKSYYEKMASVDPTNQASVDAAVSERLAKYLATYDSLVANETTLKDKLNELMTEAGLTDVSTIDSDIEAGQAALEAAKEELESLEEDDENYQTKKDFVDSIQTELDKLNKIKTANDAVISNENAYKAYEKYFADDGAGNRVATTTLKDEVKADLSARKNAATDKLGEKNSQYAVQIEGSDAKIRLNGATFTSKTNVFNVNGLTITATGVTEAGEEITLTTDQDTSGIYDMVKDFFKKYNSIINKLDEVYNAESASKYKPLTDDEKDALSEKEVEKYEQKIKDSLLKGDSTVNTITSALTEIMASGVTVGDKKMYLSDFGINTLNYFTSGDNEKHAYHIDGDEDDENSSANTDKLKSMITNDPDSVVSFFTQLTQSLYKKMSELSSSVAGYRSYGTFYNDKKMTEDYTSYNSKISKLEDKVNAYEDKLYKQYSNMEKALAKLQSNSSAVTGLLGNN